MTEPPIPSNPERSADGPLRVCFLTYPPERYSGAVFHAFWLAEKLTARGVEIEFLAFADRPQPAHTNVRGYDAHHLRAAPRWLGSYRELSLWPQLVRFLRRHRFDAVHVHSCAYLEAFAGLAARMAGTGSVANIMQQGSDLADSGRLETPIHRRLLRSFDRIVPISDETYVEARGAGLAEDRLTKIPIGVDVERFRPVAPERRQTLRERYNLPTDTPVVTYVGAFSDRKNIVWLLDAWSDSRAARAGAHLLVVGDVANDPEGDEVRRQVERRLRSAEGPIHWIRFVPEIEEIYAVSDIFVLPSLREGMPSVVLQAMASELPVLATPVAGAPELLGRDGERGRLFGFNDSAGLHAGLEALLGDEGVRHAVGRAARAHVVQHCSLQHVAERYLELYRTVRYGRAV